MPNVWNLDVQYHSNVTRLWRRSTRVCRNTKVVTFRFAISCVILRPIEKRNTRSFLNRRLLRFCNWHLNAAGVQYCHVQRAFTYARVTSASNASEIAWNYCRILTFTNLSIHEYRFQSFPQQFIIFNISRRSPSSVPVKDRGQKVGNFL